MRVLLKLKRDSRPFVNELDRAEDEAMTQMTQPHPQMPQPIPARQTGMPTQP